MKLKLHINTEVDFLLLEASATVYRPVTLKLRVAKHSRQVSQARLLAPEPDVIELTETNYEEIASKPE